MPSGRAAIHIYMASQAAPLLMMEAVIHAGLEVMLVVVHVLPLGDVLLISEVATDGKMG